MTYAAFLITMAIIDAGFAGFRDGAGRNPLLHKMRYVLVSWIKGALVGVVVVAALVVFAVVSMEISADPNELWEAYQSLGARMSAVYGAYATLAILGLVIYASPRPEVSSLITVLILGPFTLIRVPVIVAGVSWALLAAPRPETIAFAVLIALGMGGLEQWISWLEINPRELEDQIRMR